MDSLAFLFQPRSIAVVGASANAEKQGYRYLACLRSAGYPGALYPVNPKGGEMLGLKVYPSLRDIPGPVDLVICVLPAQEVPGLIAQCPEKGVKALQLYTAHLAEIGRDGEQQQIVALARRAGVRVLGPNCMGVYSPQGQMTFRLGWPTEPGKVGFISQSAGNCAEVVYRGGIRGLRFSKVVSFGNAADINETELLRFLAQDSDTEVIGAYLEGIRDTAGFRAALEAAAQQKPVIIVKAGRTAAGARAILSHTASLASNDALLDGLLRQCRVVRAYSLEELVDLLLAFNFLRPSRGSNVAAIGAGGGGSVMVSDECECQGLSLPALPGEILEQMRSFLGEDWRLIKNPVDTSVVFPAGWGFAELGRIFQLMADHPLYHLLIVDCGEWWLDSSDNAPRMHSLLETCLPVLTASAKPGVVVIRTADGPEPWRWQATVEATQRCVQAGFPVYPTIGRAAYSLARFTAYHLGKEG